MVYSVLYLLGEILMTVQTQKTVNQEKETFGALLSLSFKRYFGKGILYMILVGLISFGIYMAGAVLITGIVIAIAMALHTASQMIITMILMLIMIPLILVLGLVILVINYYLLFGYQAIVLEDLRPSEALKKSWKLVKGGFWRVLGITFLVSLILSFALSLVTGPIMMATLLPGYMKFLQSMMESNGSTENMVEMFGFFKNYGIAMGLMIPVQSFAQLLIFPAFKTLFYIDLKIRKNEMVPGGGVMELPPDVSGTAPVSGSPS
jgi:hypothetical protein